MESEEEKEWPEPKPYPDFETKKVTFVVCLNTLGQDRCFAQDEVEIALKAVKHYRDSW